MATGEELAEQVISKVQDGSYIDEVLPLLNEGVELMAAEMDFPGLHSVAVVNTVATVDSADLPAGCTMGIYLAKVNGDKIKVYASYADLHLALSEAMGEVQGVAVDGDSLRYLPVPSAVSAVTIYYYRQPATITAVVGPDLFSGRELASGLKALVHYAAMRLYDDIEDGIEGQKVNTARHHNLYLQAWAECKSQVRQGPVRPVLPQNKLWR